MTVAHSAGSYKDFWWKLPIRWTCLLDQQDIKKEWQWRNRCDNRCHQLAYLQKREQFGTYRKKAWKSGLFFFYFFLHTILNVFNSKDNTVVLKIVSFTRTECVTQVSIWNQPVRTNVVLKIFFWNKSSNIPPLKWSWNFKCRCLTIIYVVFLLLLNELS